MPKQLKCISCINASTNQDNQIITGHTDGTISITTSSDDPSTAPNPSSFLIHHDKVLQIINWIDPHMETQAFVSHSRNDVKVWTLEGQPKIDKLFSYHVFDDDIAGVKQTEKNLLLVMTRRGKCLSFCLDKSGETHPIEQQLEDNYGTIQALIHLDQADRYWILWSDQRMYCFESKYGKQEVVKKARVEIGNVVAWALSPDASLCTLISSDAFTQSWEGESNEQSENEFSYKKNILLDIQEVTTTYSNANITTNEGTFRYQQVTLNEHTITFLNLEDKTVKLFSILDVNDSSFESDCFQCMAWSTWGDLLFVGMKSGRLLRFDVESSEGVISGDWVEIKMPVIKASLADNLQGVLRSGKCTDVSLTLLD